MYSQRKCQRARFCKRCSQSQIVAWFDGEDDEDDGLEEDFNKDGDDDEKKIVEAELHIRRLSGDRQHPSSSHVFPLLLSLSTKNFMPR